MFRKEKLKVGLDEDEFQASLAVRVTVLLIFLGEGCGASQCNSRSL